MFWMLDELAKQWRKKDVISELDDSIQIFLDMQEWVAQQEVGQGSPIGSLMEWSDGELPMVARWCGRMGWLDKGFDREGVALSSKN